MDREAVVAATRAWVSSVVVGLDLCPFAGRALAAGRVRFAASAARDAEALLADLAAELAALVAAPAAEVETCLLVHPWALADFLDYNDFLGEAEALAARDYGGVVQLASFHPGYRFAGCAPEAAENYTNRSPFPMLHLLREASVSAVAADEAALLRIPLRNVETMRRLGRDRALAMLAPARAEGGRPAGP